MATVSKFPHDLADGDVFFHQGVWREADFISIGRPSVSWVTVHTKKKGSEDPTVLMLPAGARVLVLKQSEPERNRRRRANIRNMSQRAPWR
jgi:hypothetical protein